MKLSDYVTVDEVYVSQLPPWFRVLCIAALAGGVARVLWITFRKPKGPPPLPLSRD